jgi:predicted anti-sigma-YlaC factor YlaD
MTCTRSGQFDRDIVRLARGETLPPGTAGQVEAHLDGCARCAAWFARQRELSDALRGLARDVAFEVPPEALRGRVLAAFAAAYPSATKPRSYPLAWLAAAAALVVMTAAGIWVSLEYQRTRSTATETVVSAEPARTLDGFVTLPVAVGLPRLESGYIVRVELPVAALPALGVDVLPASTRNAVQADVLVGQDGQPRAIRLVPNEQNSRSRP